VGVRWPWLSVQTRLVACVYLATTNWRYLPRLACGALSSLHSHTSRPLSRPREAACFLLRRLPCYWLGSGIRGAGCSRTTGAAAMPPSQSQREGPWPSLSVTCATSARPFFKALKGILPRLLMSDVLDSSFLLSPDCHLATRGGAFFTSYSAERACPQGC
jgi:hypothetical protein